MTSRKTVASRTIATSEGASEGQWAPRLAREARVTELEALLARQPHGCDAVEIEVERAALLGALNRREEAQAAFIDILRRAPTHFGALNQFGALLTI